MNYTSRDLVRLSDILEKFVEDTLPNVMAQTLMTRIFATNKINCDRYNYRLVNIISLTKAKF